MRWSRILGVLTGIALIAGLTLAVWIIRGTSSEAPKKSTEIEVAWGRTAVDAAGLAQRSGVRITQVALTGGGGLVDLRFQVLDPNLANALHDAKTPPAVVDEQSGLVVHDLLMNHAHSAAFKAGVTYYLVFENPNNWIRRGSEVTVLLGGTEVHHMVVR
jgi:hypothetical protein